MAPPIRVRHLSAPEVHLVLDWARQEGWNPGIHGAACFHAADPGGFFGSLHDDEPAAVISLVRYDATFAFLGLYICRPELRGRGYGLAAWNAALDLAGARTIGLDGVPEQQVNYMRAGFRLAWRNHRYQGVGRGDAATDRRGVIDLDAVPFAEVAAYDAGLFEARRDRFLRF